MLGEGPRVISLGNTGLHKLDASIKVSISPGFSQKKCPGLRLKPAEAASFFVDFGLSTQFPNFYY
jgi:hypothetical protein